MFEIIVTESFAKELKKLEDFDRERIKKKLYLTAENPSRFWENLTNSPLFKLRVGKYRILAQISWQEKRINLLGVGLRKNIYDKL